MATTYFCEDCELVFEDNRGENKDAPPVCPKCGSNKIREATKKGKRFIKPSWRYLSNRNKPTSEPASSTGC